MDKLTREDIMKMEVGPELNKLVGKSLGYTSTIVYRVMDKDKTAFFIEFEKYEFIEAKKWMEENEGRIENPKDSHYGAQLAEVEIWPDFSRDIKAAWEIVEKMGRKGFTINIQYKGADREYKFTAEVDITKYIYSFSHAVGTTPEAICKAALLALMEGEHL